MNIQAQKIELIEWLLNVSEETLQKVAVIKEKTVSNNAVSYNAKGDSFTKEQYRTHINKIREDIKNGARTYSTKDVKEFILDNK